MATSMQTTAVGVFENRRDAQQAVENLKSAGFRDDQIGVVYRDGGGDDEYAVTTDDSYADEGALAGAAAGAGLGGLWAVGIAAGALPAIGPVIAGGTLAAILASAAGGAVAGGLVGTLLGLGIPEDEARLYEEEVHAGRTVVTVKADGRYHEALEILHRAGASDYHGGAGTGKATLMDEASHRKGSTMEGERSMQLREEELHARKTPVEAGEVKLRKQVRTEHKSIDVPVTKEEVFIERHPVGGHQAASSPIGAGQEIRVPVREEEVHVEKRPVVKEEVTVGKRRVKDTERVEGTIKKEEIKVEEKGDVKVRGRGPTRKS